METSCSTGCQQWASTGPVQGVFWIYNNFCIGITVSAKYWADTGPVQGGCSLSNNFGTGITVSAQYRTNIAKTYASSINGLNVFS